MSATHIQQEELRALRREVDALRAERTPGGAATANTERGTLALLEEHGDPDVGDLAGASERGGNDWADVKQAALEIAQELEAAARERPVLGMLGAFAAGLVLGRLLSR